MGTKRVGLARIQALIENLKRELSLGNATTLNINRINSNYVRFVTGDWNGLTVASKTDTQSRAGFTMADGYVYENAVDGSTGASAIVLPSATAGALIVHRFVAQADGGQNITFTTASGEYYAAGTIMLTVSNVSAGQLMTRCTQTDWTQTSVSPSNGEIKTMDGTTENTITIATTATNNQTNIGAEIAFYCDTGGKWRWSWRGAQLGSGVVNATFTVTAV